jgi:integrase
MPRAITQSEGVYENIPGSGIWYVRYRVKGKLVRKSIGKYQAAVNYHSKVKVLIRSGEGHVPTTAKDTPKTDRQIANQALTVSGVTVSDLCDDLLTHIKERPEVYKDQRNPPDRIEAIRAEFGDRQAASIRPFEITTWLDSMKKRDSKKMKPATLNRMKAMLSAVYQLGKHGDKVKVNPARDVKQRNVGGGVIRFLTEDEETRLRATLLGQIKTKAHLSQYQEPQVRHRLCELDVALGTGMRKGEQYGLRWKDVDFDSGVITLHDTKNRESRLVYMIDDVVTALRALQKLGLNRREGRTHPAPEDAVFAIGDNKKWWAAALKDAKIENFRWHDLRHTFCSRLSQNGASLKIIQEAAGHKTIAMAARYAHMDQSSLRSAMAVLNRSI